jgi:acetoin utilization deacetylase AcuC-like enzyme
MANGVRERVPVFFHPDQLLHSPMLEWAFGRRLRHPETSRRAGMILHTLQRHASEFEVRSPSRVPLHLIRAVHAPAMLAVFETAARLPPDETFYPSVFPKRSQTRGDPTDIHQSGYFCYDSGTPLNARSWDAAGWSAACAVEAADAVARGTTRLSYALSRPPGHHVSRDLFGGYCYLNNAAIAARHLKPLGRRAILDIDFHHGNGTQSLFYRDPDVLFVSIHGDPRDFYPFFSGGESERGAGRGAGFNHNLPLPAGTTGDEYLRVLEREALPAIASFDPAVLIVSAGFDTWGGDPIGRFALDTEAYQGIGRAIGGLGRPTVVVQEGGYATQALGQNVVTFLRGLRDGR